jgi:5-(carboxyamino)imidazole ribonucleotide mutase
MKALVLFGSESDKPVYSELMAFLEKDFDVEFEVISAHRNPDKLDIKLKEDNFDLLFAGAGIAAHLPGVCASKTNKPVFGIPVEGNLSGLDALLSIQQMPFGIPVATMGSRKWSNALELVESAKKSRGKINIIVNSALETEDFYQKEISRTKEYVEKLGLDMTIGNYDKDRLNINLVNKESEIISDMPCLQVPLLNNDEKNAPETAMTLLKWSNLGGFWVGINNTRNAICFSQKL